MMSRADRGVCRTAAAAGCRARRCCSPRTACPKKRSRTAIRMIASAARRRRWWRSVRESRDWEFAYQSQGMTDDEWLGPTVESMLDRYAADGLREVVIDPDRLRLRPRRDSL